MSLISWMTGTGPDGLQTSGTLSREAFIQFSKACTDQFESADFITELRTAVQQQKDPEDLVEIMQFKEFEKIGIQGHFGVSQLKHIQKNFNKDAEVMGALMTLVNAEEGILDKAQLSPEALESKKQAGEELMKIQWAIRTCSADMSEDQQKQFSSDVQAAMRSAATQVPKQENASTQEAVAAVREQMRCACATLRKQGYAIPEDIIPPRAEGSAGSQAAAPVVSSVMTAEEQQRFLSSIRGQ